MKKHQKDFEENREDSHIREFLDMIAPSVIWFETDHFICGNTYRCVWAIREYPTATDEQAILSHLGEKDGVTLHIYTRHVTAMEEKRIISNAVNKNRLTGREGLRAQYIKQKWSARSAGTKILRKSRS